MIAFVVFFFVAFVFSFVSCFDLPCNVCWAVLNEIEGLLAENQTQFEIERVLRDDLCAALPSHLAATACDSLATLGVPFLVATLNSVEHVGAACQQLRVCALPEPTHRDLWQVPRFVLNLDLPPAQRWPALFHQHPSLKLDVLALVDVVTMLVPAVLHTDLQALGQLVYDNLDPDYQGEIDGIAAAVGTKPQYIAIAQTAYDLTDCTSIVANTASDVMHFRNLDFGAGLGFTDTLRDLLVHVVVQRNGSTVMHVQTYAGYLGVLTGMVPGKFSVTINTRYESGVFPFGAWYKILQQMLAHPSAVMPAHLVRETLLSQPSYAAAGSALANTPILGRVYYTLGGVNLNEGRLIARSQNAVAHDVSIGHMPRADWFVLQTNYDWWNKTVPFYDDRRDAGINSMLNNVGSAKNVGMLSVITDVLSIKPTFNQLTTVSVAMHVASGDFIVMGRYCTAPCPF
jgi:hypothetical protein